MKPPSPGVAAPRLCLLCSVVVLSLPASSPRAEDKLGARAAAGLRYIPGESYPGFFLDELELYAESTPEADEGISWGAAGHLKLRPADLPEDGSLSWTALVEQARVSVGKGDAWRLYLGRSIAPMGWEEVETGKTYFASHGLLFDYGSPLAITGALVETSAVPDLLSLTAFVSNGFDQALPVARIAGGLRADLSLADGVDVGLVGLFDGPAATDRTLWFSADASLELGGATVGVEGTWGKTAQVVTEEVEASNGELVTIRRGAQWAGAMISAALPLGGELGGALRLEWFHDPDGLRQQDFDAEAVGGDLLAGTLALILGHDGELTGRQLVLEYRYDHFLAKKAGSSEGSHALTLMAAHGW